MNEEITSLLNQLLAIGIKLLIIIAGIWLTKIGIPWLKRQKIYSLVKILVKAAEKKADAGSIEKSYKKMFVTNLLVALGVEVTEEIDAMIESAVEELDKISVAALAQLAEPATVTGFACDTEDDTEDTDDGV